MIQTAHDERFCAHRPGDDAPVLLAGTDGAFAGDPQLTAVVVLFGRLIVMAVDARFLSQHLVGAGLSHSRRAYLVPPKLASGEVASALDLLNLRQ